MLNSKPIAYGGDLAVGAMGIINSVISMVVMDIVAINMASQPIIGFNYGAKKTDRVKEALKKAVTGATLIALFSFVIIEVFAWGLVTMFNTSSKELSDIAVPAMKIFILGLPLVGFQIVTGNYFQSVGRAKIAMILTLMRQVLLLLPFLLIFPVWWKLNGIWVAFPAADTLSACIVASFLIREWQKLNRIRTI